MQVKLGRIQISVAVINTLLSLILYLCQINHIKIVEIINILNFIPLCCSIYFCDKTYKTVAFKKIVLLYVITFALFFNCISSSLAIHFRRQINVSIMFSVIDILFYSIACMLMIYFILNKINFKINILKKHWVLGLMSLFMTISLNLSFIFCLFIMLHKNILFVFVAGLTILISMCTLEIILLGMVFCKSPPIKYVLLGFLFTINSVFVQTSSLNNVTFYYLGQISWYLGLWIFSIGLYGLTRVTATKYNEPDEYFNFTKGEIRNLLTIRTLILSLTSTAIICEILLLSNTISFERFLLIPPGIIMFSLAMFVALDNTFNDVQKDFNNVLNLITNVSDQKTINNLNFSTSEFETIKKFVINSFTSLNTINEKHNHLEKINYLNELKIIEENSRYKELLIKKNAIEALAAKDKDFISKVSLLVHDIKSPTTLIHNIIEQNSNLLNQLDVSALELANKRILFLTQSLLKNYQQPNDLNHDIYFSLFWAIDNAITEFRSAYKSIAFEFNYNLKDCVYLLHGNLNMFERMLINLIDNAVNALNNISNAKIIIDLLISDNFIQINISDNGPGMPETVKESFFAKIQIKSTKPDGNGIGLRQVSETLDMFSANCKIESSMGNGTTFKLSFPKFNHPHWICEHITLIENQNILIFDDDINIHKLWDNIFAKYISEGQIKVTHFQDVDVFNQYISRLTNLDKQNILFLCDYDIGNTNFNGLDLIKNLQVQNSILATGHFEKHTLQEELDKLQIRMLDKRTISYIQVEFEENQKNADMVWLDDQEFFPKYIVNKFYQHLKVDIYREISDFLKNIIAYKLDTIIILDFNLNSTSKMDGISVAKKLHEMGFTNLIILTADTIYFNDLPDYVKLINKSDHDVANLENVFKS